MTDHPDNSLDHAARPDAVEPEVGVAPPENKPQEQPPVAEPDAEATSAMVTTQDNSAEPPSTDEVASETVAEEAASAAGETDNVSDAVAAEVDVAPPPSNATPGEPAQPIAEDPATAQTESPSEESAVAEAAQPHAPPVEETPVEETPVEETPVEETPVEEATAEDTPNEDEETPGDAEDAARGGDADDAAGEAQEPTDDATTPPDPPDDGNAVAVDEADEALDMQWYILKVQSNREESIKNGLLRRARIAGLEHFFGDIIVPTETVTEFKGGKKRTVKRKLYPGYIIVNMEINDETWFLVRETPGIGDFTGAGGKPVPLERHEYERFIPKEKGEEEESVTLDIKCRVGDRVKINDGPFEGFEGEVEAIDSTHGRVTVMINVFGRPTPVELEYWQIEVL